MSVKLRVASVLFSIALFGVALSQIYAAPSVTNAAATPASIVVNTPTSVLVTAVITDPSVIPTGVNLLRYSPTGQASIVGNLRDNGANGDAQAGDGIYSVRLLLNEPAERTIQFRVSAAFKGLFSRVLSNAFAVVAAAATNTAPVANAGPDQPTAHVGLPVSLNGAASSDPDGDPLTFQWKFFAVPAGNTAVLNNPTAPTPSFVPSTKGAYVLELIVHDGKVASAPDTVSVLVVNTEPTANAGADFTQFVGQPAALDGSASSDPDGDSLTYAWAFVSRPASSLASLSDPQAVAPTFLVDAPGTYVVQLVVNDGTVESLTDTVTITTQNSPPTANAGPDQTAAVNADVTLNGGASADADGDPLTYTWSFESRPPGSGAALLNHTSVTPTFTIDVPGSYVVRLIVNDGQANSLADTVVISTENSAPVAHAGPDQTVFVSQIVTVDASGSTDVDGNALSYAWSFVSRPTGSAATLSSPTAVNPTFVADKPGTYALQLMVHDGFVNSAADVVLITTQNSPPIAHAGADQSVFVTQEVTLDGSASSDVDGNALTYNWSLSSVPVGSAAALSNPTAVSPTFTADRPGTYVAQLIVHDGSVASAPDTVTITTGNTAPVANAGPDQAVVAGQFVTLNGASSSDVDGDSITAKWSFTSRPPGSTAILANDTTLGPSFTADQPGTYVVQLIVNDGTIDSAPDTVVITTDNTTPVANAGPDQLNVLVGSTVALHGGASNDQDGHPLTFSWSLLSKPIGSAASLSNAAAVSPTFVADEPGDYVAQLIVNDGFVDSAPDTVLIRTANQPPVANAGADQAVAVGANVSLNGTASSDPDGNPLTFTWTLTSRPAESSAALSDPAAATPSLIVDRAGAYIVELVVNDGSVDSLPDTVVITATATNNAPVAAQDGYEVVEGGVLNVAAPGVLGNDSDPDGNALTAILETSVANGLLSLNADGSFQYQPAPGFAGLDGFQYRASDGAAQSGPATAAIAVRPAPPTVTGPIAAGATAVAGTGAHSGASVRVFVNGIARGPATNAAADGGWTVSGIAPALVAGEVVTARQTVATLESNASAGVTVSASGGSSAVIGPGGGTVQLTDGTRVEIPPGALTAPTQITVTPIPVPANAVLPPTGVFVGQLYSFEPHGLQFNQPVTMTFPYDPALVPPGYEEGAISVHRLSSDGTFDMVGSIGVDPEPESSGQQVDPVANVVSVTSSSFSDYGAVAVNSAAQFVSAVLTSGNASVTVLRPTAAGGLRTTRSTQHSVCTSGSTALATRASVNATVDAVVLHSTNSGNTNRSFNGELGWATSDCNTYFTHYYLDRDGRIFQIVDDSLVALHTRTSQALGISNDNAIGIELFNNVGEPYDGRMIASLIRLLDYLTVRHNLPRPQRDANGTMTRSVGNIANAGAERIVTHWETDPTHKRDPIGTFQHSDIMVYLTSFNDAFPYNEAPVPNGEPDLTLIRVVADAIASLHRTEHDTGVINTSGGDSFGTFNGGNAGSVTWREDLAQVNTNVGAATQRLRTDNTPLLIPAGETRNVLANQVFTDAIILGTLDVTQAVNLRLTGTLFLGPSGRIIARNGLIGQAVQISTRGLPLVQGLLETAALDADAAQAGANGGNVDIFSAASGPFLIPTIVARGGDADSADVPGGIGAGGTGGAVTVDVTAASHLFIGGGVGADARPAIRSSQVDAALMLIPPPDHVGDRLPLPPPFNLGSFGLDRAIAGQRVPLRKYPFQKGFTRGILTSGGMGGTGIGTNGTTQVGGAGGAGGAITLDADATGIITFRDVDLTTGADVEMALSDIFVFDGGFALQLRFYGSTGSLGGRGTITGSTRGGNGGVGGAAGAIGVTGVLNPPVADVTSVGGPFDDGDIIGFNGQRPLHSHDPLLSFIIGTTRQASGGGSNLYRLRVNSTGQALGGAGGIPSGHGSANPGSGGVVGAGAAITGIPK